MTLDTIHYINLATWLTRNDSTPAGSICAKIFRDQSVEMSVEFFINAIALSNETWNPTNIINALVFYIGETGLTTEQKTEIKNNAENIPAEILEVL